MVLVVDTSVVGVVPLVSGGFLRLLVVFGLSFVVWFLLTVLVMLVSAKKNAKRGRVIMVFVVSSIVYVCLLVWGYLNVDTVVRVFNV